MPTNPQDYISKKVPGVPYDKNNKPLAGLVVPIVSAGEIVGYLPLKAQDNGDGTATLDVGATLNLSPGDFQIGAVEIKDGDTDRRADVEDDGTNNALIVTANVLPLPTGAATETTLALVLAALDTVETKLQSIADNTDTLEVNTDDLEAKLDTLIATDFATETTLLGVKTAVDAINSDIDTPLSTRASESTLVSAVSELTTLNAALDTVETKLQSIIDNTDTLEINTDELETKLDTLIATDFATETTLAGVKTAVDAINADLDVALSTRASEATLLLVKTNLDTLNATDFATETTLAGVKAAVDSIDTDIDVALSTRASEATLISVLAALDTVETKLQSIIDNTDSLEVNTDDLETKVQSVRDQLDVLLSTRASETTLAGVKAKTDLLTFTGTSLNVHTDDGSSSSAVTTVARNAASVTLLAANSSRKGATIYNDSGAFLYIKLGATAATSSFTVRVGSQSYYEVTGKYTGIIDGIWASGGGGDAKITELT